MSTWAWVDGELAPAGSARIGVTDRALLLGEGVFETCKVVDGVPFALTRHLARLRHGAEAIGLDVPWGDSYVRSACARAVGAALADTSDPADGPVARLRITITGGAGPMGPSLPGAVPSLVVLAGPGRPGASSAVVATVDWRVNERSPVAGLKVTSYAAQVRCLAEARAKGADEALLANSIGALCEGSLSNVFLEVGGVLCTPSLATGCLPGITRALVLECVDVVERSDLTFDHLRSASEAFLTSSTRDVHPIARIDGRVLPSVPGPFTAAASGALAALQARTLDP